MTLSPRRARAPLEAFCALFMTDEWPSRCRGAAVMYPPLAVRSMGSGGYTPGARAASTNVSFISAVMCRSSSVISSNCTCSMYECGMYVPSKPSFDPASTTAARTFP